MCTLFFAAGHQFDFKNVWTFEELLVNLNIFQSYWTLVKKRSLQFLLHLGHKQLENFIKIVDDRNAK